MRYKITWHLVLFTFIIMASVASASENETASDELRDAVHRVRDAVLDYFKPVDGFITGVDGDSVKGKLQGASTVNKGVRFSVFRAGAPFYHPVTNELIGKAENFIGRVEVVEPEADEGSYSFIVIQGDLKAGDIVRITTSNIKLAFFQDRKSDWSLSELFYKALKDSGRFDILEKYTPVYEPDHLAGLARELGAEATLMFSTPVSEEQKRLDVKLFWAEDAQLFGEVQEVVSRDVTLITTPGEEFLAASVVDREPWGSFKVSKGRLIAIGDVDGTEGEELILSDGNNIIVYGMKDELRVLWTIEGTNAENHLSLDVLDVNGNGVSEIFVTSMVDSNRITTDTDDIRESPRSNDEAEMNSYVLEYEAASGYRRIAEGMPYFLRVMGNRLLMQKYDWQHIFSGPVHEAAWLDGQYTPQKALKLPGNLNIYGFTYVDWENQGKRHIVSYTDKGYLIMYDAEGNQLWKSSRSFGDFALTFSRKTISLASPVRKWSVRGRLIPVKTARGQEVVVVDKIPFVSQVSMPGLGYRGAEVHSLWWDGASMDDRRILDEVSGKISDFWVQGRHLFLMAKGGMLSLVKNAASGEFEKGSLIYYYDMGPQ